MLNRLFSIENNLNQLQIKILGIKIKFTSSYKDQKYYHNLPIQNNKIVFRNHAGSYGDNVKYITEEILRQKLPYDLVWVVNKHILKFQKDFPKDVRLVMTGTPEAYKEYATARIWIDTDRRAKYITKGLFKREGQFYIQCFHGAFGIKKCGPDRNDRSRKFWKPYKIDAEQTDFFISNSTQATNFFIRTFWNSGKILEFGQPRNDIFFDNTLKIKEKVYKHFNIPNDKKIIFYAPTFREHKNIECYLINYEALIKAMSKKFGKEYIIMFRLHPFFANLKDKFINNYEWMIDATDYSDMQELLVSADCVITDYSSCIYDFMLTYKPAFIFATDRKKYENCRGLYYPLSSTPFPVAENNDELIKNIENFDYKSYKVKVKEFLQEKGSVDDGHSCERIVELIKKIMQPSDTERLI